MRQYTTPLGSLNPSATKKCHSVRAHQSLYYKSRGIWKQFRWIFVSVREKLCGPDSFHHIQNISTISPNRKKMLIHLYHAIHNFPHFIISITYYVRTPKLKSQACLDLHKNLELLKTLWNSAHQMFSLNSACFIYLNHLRVKCLDSLSCWWREIATFIIWFISQLL